MPFGDGTFGDEDIVNYFRNLFFSKIYKMNEAGLVKKKSFVYVFCYYSVYVCTVMKSKNYKKLTKKIIVNIF
jgi:hypothetical protein